MRLAIIITLLTAASVHAWAQSDWIWNQYLYSGDTNLSRGGIWCHAEYGIQTNTLSNKLMNEAIYQGRINSATSDAVVDLNSADYTRLSAGTNGAIWYRTARPNAWRFLFGLGYNDHAIGLMKNGVAQLYLKGNGPFEDQKMELGPSEITYHSYQFAGLGIEHGKQNVTWGITAQLIKSSRYTHLKLGESSLYTAPYGTAVESSLNFRYDASASEQAKLSAWYGTGYSLNAYYVYKASEKAPMICVELRDAGQIFYQGVRRLRLNDSLNFYGVGVNNILQLDDSLVSGENLDSIEALLGLQQSHPKLTTWLPAHFNIHFIQPLSEKVRLEIGLKQYVSMGIPEVAVGIAFQPKPWISFEPRIRFGGFTRFDVGLNAFLQAGQHLQIILKSEQFENLIAPDKSTSQYLFFGGQVSF
ncbi:MAG: hypothetical protein R2813_01105 [Flavobacteriales bacterium]